MDFTVFYAWQMDSPTRTNKELIRLAAQEACTKLSAESNGKWNVSLNDRA